MTEAHSHDLHHIFKKAIGQDTIKAVTLVSAEMFKSELRYLMTILIFCKCRTLTLSKAGSFESVSRAIGTTDGF